MSGTSRRVMGILAAMWFALFFHSGLFANGKEGSEPSHGHWSAPPQAAKRTNPFPPTQASIERGKELFQKHCAACHGQEGRGDGLLAGKLNPKPANLVQTAGHHSAGEIAWKIEIGRGPMPAWKGVLSTDDIWHLTNFLQGLAESPPPH